jgi:hypothetical protein
VADQEEESIQQTVQKGMADVLAGARPLPVPTPVTEVIVRPGQEVILRVGSPHALRTMHHETGWMPSGPGAVCGGCSGGCGRTDDCGDCGDCGGSSCGSLAFSAAEEGLIQQLSARLQVPREQLLNDLLARALGAEIRRLAAEEGINPEPGEAADS